MTRTLLPVALAAALLASAAAPALAVSIKHTSRVDGDPEAAAAPRSASRATPPADTSGPHYFDKLHENGTRG